MVKAEILFLETAAQWGRERDVDVSFRHRYDGWVVVVGIAGEKTFTLACPADDRFTGRTDEYVKHVRSLLGSEAARARSQRPAVYVENGGEATASPPVQNASSAA